MIISHKKKFIFFACGKTGTTSIEKILKKYHDDKFIVENIEKELELLRKQNSKPYHLKHVRPSFVKKYVDKEIWDEYFKFTFVRNPWDWVYSQFCYNYKYLINKTLKFEDVHVDAIWYMLKIFDQSDDNEGYYQHPFAYSEDGSLLVDFVGRFENLQNDFNRICKIIGIKAKNLPHMNKTIHSEYKNLYSQEAKKLVDKYYKKDIELFKYDF
ncbi:sulfotransferase family 2 domain-containing protein [Candidatus Peregrinibacteria bacterium]|nr:sulfotransferase family 2 domain-containing protein [Candidatus Peregrinibacteria bacterium]